MYRYRVIKSNDTINFEGKINALATEGWILEQAFSNTKDLGSYEFIAILKKEIEK